MEHKNLSRAGKQIVSGQGQIREDHYPKIVVFRSLEQSHLDCNADKINQESAYSRDNLFISSYASPVKSRLSSQNFQDEIQKESGRFNSSCNQQKGQTNFRLSPISKKQSYGYLSDNKRNGLEESFEKADKAFNELLPHIDIESRKRQSVKKQKFKNQASPYSTRSFQHELSNLHFSQFANLQKKRYEQFKEDSDQIVNPFE